MVVRFPVDRLAKRLVNHGNRALRLLLVPFSVEETHDETVTK